MVVTALGRGFHDADIRFIFHSSMPLSLRDYVQETGRGGRDSKPSFCTLFFSFFDLQSAESVVGLSPARNGMQLQGIARARAREELDQVIEYALAGDQCRYSMLAAAATLEEGHPWDQRCSNESKCDNCRSQEGKLGTIFTRKCEEIVSRNQKKEVEPLNIALSKRDVTAFIKKCLLRLLEESRANSYVDELRVLATLQHVLLEIGSKEPAKDELFVIQALLKEDDGKSLLIDVVRFFRSKSFDGNVTTDFEKIESFVEGMEDSNIRFFIQYAVLPTSGMSSTRVYAVESAPIPNTLATKSSAFWCPSMSMHDITEFQWPFLIQFEICR